MLPTVNIAICDDNMEDRESIRRDIRAIGRKEHRISPFENGQDLVDHYRERRLPFDIIVLDIVMPQLDGIETAKRLREIDDEFVLILLTSSHEYTLEGYVVEAFRYLMKPLQEQELRDALEGALKKVSRKRETLVLKTGREYLRLQVSQITHVTVDRNSLLFHLASGDTKRIYGSMKEHLPMLTAAGFVQVFTGIAVNLHLVSEVKTNQKRVVLTNGLEFEVSRHMIMQVTSAFFVQRKEVGE